MPMSSACGKASARRSMSRGPTKPLAPVTMMREKAFVIDRPARCAAGPAVSAAPRGSSRADADEIGIDHLADHLLERDFGLPAELGLGLGRIAEQDVDLSRAEEVGVDHDIAVHVEPHMP